MRPRGLSELSVMTGIRLYRWNVEYRVSSLRRLAGAARYVVQAVHRAGSRIIPVTIYS